MTFSVLELSELLEVSKPTVSRAIKELEKEGQIKPQRQGAEDSKNKKLLLSDDDVIKIIKLIKPTEFEKIIETNRKIAEYFATKAKRSDTESEKSDTKADQSDSEKNKEQQNNSLIIEILRKELEDKQKTIESLTEQNKMLITSNAYLSKLLEDKGDHTVQEGEFTEVKADQQKEEPAAPADQTDQQPPKKTIWERLKALFS